DPIAGIVTGGDTVDEKTVGTYYITYDVTVMQGDTPLPATQKIRTIHVVDTTPPTITLMGHDTITLECGTPFDTPVAVATDDCEVTSTVISEITDANGRAYTKASVDTGTYTITYRANDSHDNI